MMKNITSKSTVLHIHTYVRYLLNIILDSQYEIVLLIAKIMQPHKGRNAPSADYLYPM